MACYSKGLEDYLRIPVLLKNITPISEKAYTKLTNLLYYKQYSLIIDERYIRQTFNANSDILKNRENITQKLYFIPEDFNSDWPEYQIIYKAKFVLGVIDEGAQQKQIQQILSKIKNETGIKLIGVINLGSSTLQSLIKKENIIKCPDLSEEEFLHFIEPWLYNCLSLIEAEICNTIAELKKDDETNRTIVFNRMQEKFDSKIMKKKKKFRCIKLCGDYQLMLSMYKQAFDYFNEAEELLKKIDDYLWILGCLQGKLACVIASPQIDLSNREEYIQQLINETYLVSKKTKHWNFQVENYFKIAKLHIDQPQKFDELIRNFLVNYSKNLVEDEKFLLYTVIGSLYERCGFIRKRNCFYFLAAMIHLSKKSQVSTLLLIEIQKAQAIRQWPQLYKRVLHQIIQEEGNASNNNFYLQLLSKCANKLSQKEISGILSELNFSNNEIIHLETLQFLELKEFYAQQSPIKPKQNRIGNRESPRKVGGGFFMSWKRDENLLFEQNQEIVIKGSIVNKIAFPIRAKIHFQIHSLAQKQKICAQQELYVYLEPSTVHKFQSRIKAKGETQEIWVIDKIRISMWNFQSDILLPASIKYEIYEKQPEIDLDLKKQLVFEESCNLFLETQLKIKNFSVPFCLIKLNVSVYYTIDVGFQQNEVILRDSDQFLDIDFNNKPNLRIYESKTNDCVEYYEQKGVLVIMLKKLKAHRRNVNRIEFTLEYIRNLNTKYQISKQYVGKCSFYSKFTYRIEEITTPIIEKIYKNPIKNLKIIENKYKLKLKIAKTNIHNLKSYIFTYNNTIYKLSNTQELIIEQIKDKVDPNTTQQEFRDVLYWQCESTQVKGEIDIDIPLHELMRKSTKKVTIAISEQMVNMHKKLKISYQITAEETTNLSHHVIFNPVELEIGRMYVLRGKSKFEVSGTQLSNNFDCIFSQKCKNSYQMGLIFTDGWIYWHQDLIHINST